MDTYQWMKAYSQAFQARDLTQLAALISPDITWEAVSQQTLKGWQQVATGIAASPYLSRVEVDQCFAQGREGAQFGTLITEDGERFPFAESYCLNESGKAFYIKTFIGF